ncbi:TIGR02099 family protein [Ottowia sp. GY511]|uniref:YhdP family protein n=1 Tax=Ottowia flava TaxID=2675430 RepID=A0ABW4KWA0_9BURK|nr:YhdP family protein [Ottowia sp. GY511]TXK27056.1 TIGR02099 family protein [Ottowia sp. GY511]
MRWVTRLVGAAFVLLILAAIVLHWVILPRIDEFRPRLEAMVTRAISAPVTIGGLRAESNGLVPTVSLHDVRVHDPTGRAGLQLPRVLASFSVLSLARGELEQLVIEQPTLEVRRTADGRLRVGGIDMSGDASSGDTGAADWFFSQDEFLVLGGRLRWVDEKRAVEPVELRDVQVVVRNGHRRHQMRIDATPDAQWGQRFTLMGQFRQPVFSRHAGYWKDWVGELYADVPHADVSRLRQYLDLSTDWGVDLRQGQGALRLWAHAAKGQLTQATADLALGAVSVRFDPKLEPLSFASLTGRVDWRGQNRGLALSTEGLKFVDADGLAWPGGNFRFNYREPLGIDLGGGTLAGERLDLAALAKIASRLPLPAVAHERLQAHSVAGLVESLDARWDGSLSAPRDWQVRTRVSDLSVAAMPAAPDTKGEPVAGVPGLRGAVVDAEVHPKGGKAQISMQKGALEFPGVFEQPTIEVADLATSAHWRVEGEQLELTVDELRLTNADATGSFKARWTTGDGQTVPRFPGVLDLQGAFSRANGASVHRYLPLAIPSDARHYVRDAIVKGEARDVAVRVKGDLRHVATHNPPPGTEFRIAGKTQGVTMAYVPRAIQPAGQPAWPALEDLSGELIFEHSSMRIRDARGRVQGHPGWQFTQIQAGIADLQNTRVLVDGEGRGPLAAALGIAKASPVAGFTQHALDNAEGSGEAALRLKLDLPISHIDKARVDGRVVLKGNDLRLSADSPRLGQARGEISFSQAGFAIHDVRVQLLGGEAQVSGGMQRPPGESAAAGVVVRARGAATAEGLRSMADWAPLPALAERASGSAAYEAVISFNGPQPDVQVTSDLRGMAWALPAPLNKTAEAAWPLRYASRASAEGRSDLNLRVGDALALHYERDTHAVPARVLRGVLALGAVPAEGLKLPGSGVIAQVQLPRLETGPWEELLGNLFGGSEALAPAAPGDSGFLPTQWTMKVDELVADDRSLHQVSATGTRVGALWRADVQARELAGRIEYSEGAGGRAGKVHARLARLSIPAPSGGEGPATLGEPPAHIPALDVVVDDFELRGKKLGRLELQAINHDVVMPRQGAGIVQEWELSHLGLTMPEGALSATGRWATRVRAPALPVDPRAPRDADDRRRTALNLKIDIRDAGALLKRFDMPGVLARGKGTLSGQLTWAGAPTSPHYPTMSGALHLDVDAGQFLKADPGIAKLLGVLSLQALPRRLTLDFRDLFSTGFAFDYVRGDVTLERGVATTNNLQMKGVNAAVLMDGSADIDRETQNLRVVVVPEIDAGTAALAATVINPAIGIGAFIAQLVLKQPLIKAATREFHVGGTWADPQVTQIKGRTAPATVPGAPASAPEAGASGTPGSQLPQNATMEESS